MLTSSLSSLASALSLTTRLPWSAWRLATSLACPKSPRLRLKLESWWWLDSVSPRSGPRMWPGNLRPASDNSN